MIGTVFEGGPETFGRPTMATTRTTVRNTTANTTMVEPDGEGMPVRGALQRLALEPGRAARRETSGAITIERGEHHDLIPEHDRTIMNMALSNLICLLIYP